MIKHNYTRRAFLTRLAPALALVPGTGLAKSLFSETGSDGFTDLFDGKTLTGWHTNRQKIGHGTGGHWQVENGALTGEQDPPGSGNGGVLMTDKKYGDFELLIDLAPDWGVDSGVFLRTNSSGECFQVYVDYHEKGDVGFISTERAHGKHRMYIRPFYINSIRDNDGNLKGFETHPDDRKEAWGPDFLTYHCTPEQWKKTWKIGGWNTLRIRCVGKYPKISTWINGTRIAEFNGNTSRSPLYNKEELFQALGREGSIALQVHGGKGWPSGAKCRWKNIRVKSL
ncbi:DUF1080 domain-containing protein [Compostibacter hankyongensis]|uniref:DUF1080 domain-containing protein n=1 Tax=Compostibacter hankyongensis TaxID=1007089 RepID=A0ABP8FJT4_9BACT